MHRGGYVLKEKLKRWELKLKEWNKNQFGNIQQRLNLIEEEMKNLDKKEELQVLFEGEVPLRIELQEKLNKVGPGLVSPCLSPFLPLLRDRVSSPPILSFFFIHKKWRK